MSHLQQSDLLQFLAGTLSDDEAESVYAHLDECAPCASRARSLELILADFSKAWDSFIQIDPSMNPEDESGGSTVILSLCGLADRQRGSAALAPRSSASAWQASLDPLVEGAASSGPEDEIVRRELFSSLGNENSARANDAWIAFSELDESARRRVVVSFAKDGIRIGFIACDASRKSLSLIVEHPPESGTLVAEVRSPESVWILVPKKVPAVTYLLAELEDVPESFFIDIYVR